MLLITFSFHLPFSAGDDFFKLFACKVTPVEWRRPCSMASSRLGPAECGIRRGIHHLDRHRALVKATEFHSRRTLASCATRAHCVRDRHVDMSALQCGLSTRTGALLHLLTSALCQHGCIQSCLDLSATAAAYAVNAARSTQTQMHACRCMRVDRWQHCRGVRVARGVDPRPSELTITFDLAEMTTYLYAWRPERASAARPCSVIC